MGKMDEPMSEGERIEKSILAPNDGPDAPILFLIGPNGPVEWKEPSHKIPASWWGTHLEGVRLPGRKGPVLMLAGMAGRTLIPTAYLRHVAKALLDTADAWEKETPRPETCGKKFEGGGTMMPLSYYCTLPKGHETTRACAVEQPGLEEPRGPHGA